MNLRFACPSCGAVGCVDANLAGKHLRCKHCKHRFAVPDPDGPAQDAYALREPDRAPVGPDATSPAPDSTFVPRRGRETISPSVPRAIGPSSSGPATRPTRRRGRDFAWQAWLIQAATVAVLASAAVALFAPRGTLIVGCLLMTVGTVMVLAGFLAGAYGAFHEDFLYGFLYLLVPLYTAYYLITRWDDLWAWFACSTIGVVLVTLGTEMLRWNGVGS